MKGLKAKFIINAVNPASAIILALLTTPLYMSRIGEDRYGLLSLVWIMLGYFGFLDFGLSRATANALAKMNNSPAQERGSVFMTSMWTNVLLGSIGGIIIALAGGHILMATHGLPDHLRIEVQSVMIWIAPMLPLSLMSGVSIGALEARERFLMANTIQISSNIVGQLLPLLAAIYISPTLTTVIPVTLAVRAVTTVVTLITVINSEKLHQFNLFDLKRAKSLMGYGAWLTITNLISPLMASIDQFVIGNMIGASYVARYAVPMNAAIRLQFMNGALVRTVFPRFSNLEHKEAAALAVKSFIAIAYLSAMLFAPALVVAHPFFNLWMGKAFAVYAAPVAMVLFLGAWINGVAFIPCNLLLGQGRPDIIAKIHTVEILPYLGLLWFLVHKVGLTGAAMAWFLRVAIDAVIMLLLSRMPLRGLLPTVPAFAAMIAGYWLGTSMDGMSPILLVALASALSLGIGAIGLLIVPSLREAAVKLWGFLFRKAQQPV